MHWQDLLSVGIPLISFISYCGLLILAFKSLLSKVSKIFISYLLAMLLWSFGSLMMRTGAFPGTLEWNRIMVCGMVFVPFVFFQFAQEILELASLDYLVKIGYGFGAIFLVCNLLGLIVKNAYIDSGNLVYSLGVFAQIFAVVGGGYTLASAVLLMKKRFNDPKSFSTNRLVYPSIGSVLMLIACIINLFPEIGKYPFDIAANTVNAFLLTYDIYRYRLLNITITLRKGLLYSVLTVILSSTYLLTVFLLEKILKIKTAGNIALIIALTVAAVISLIFEPFKAALKVCIDKIFFGRQYNYRKTLKAFSSIMTSILDLNKLTHSTVELLVMALQVKSAAIFLPDLENNFYVHASIGIEPDAASAVRLDKTSPVVCWLSQGTETTLSIEEIETLPEFRSLWQREREDLHELGTRMLVGIKMNMELIGILLLSGKTSEDPYSDDDLELILTLANESAIAINNSRMYMEAKTQAIRDDLTKLYNYRFLQEFLDKEISRCARTKQSLSVIFMDLDHFKTYNDIYGHLAGDTALTKVAGLITECIRATDVAARYGGDEFAIVLPGTDANSALAVAERIKNSVHAYFPGAESSSKILTVSIGVAFFPEHAQNKQSLLFCADKALYEAKNYGRNRISVYGVPAGRVDFVGENAETEHGFLKKQVEDAYLAVIQTLAATINARDNYTYIHSEMVTKYAVALAEALGLSEERKKIIRYAAMLHDIGKIGIPENILNKPGPLTVTERDVVQEHVKIGEVIVSQSPFLQRVAPIILHHHEAYDGCGYPDGLKGEKIPFESRILAIADAYHAMTSDRPYRQALTWDEAIDHLQLLAGKQFDSGLVPVFVRVIRNEQKSPTMEQEVMENIMDG